MEITVKRGNKYTTKTGFSVAVIESEMAKILNKHQHICGNCVSRACLVNGKRNLQNSIVKKGVRTLNRDFIFECDGFEEMDINKVSNPSKVKTYEPVYYRITDSDIRRTIDRI